ncbi:hypothetical protein RM50_17895 [Pseudarthrobacter phenanthrenivorans]|uniref:Uncharacterized protein n=1 Tax=Pseudarthrobacter phenanthrenivorans TaxID=361575 RepID=A0A0B4D6Q4_PSEPS|nr:hypothetical protein RM50_17895 [Pseudarthrobacter phenanthrenivorans]
MVVVPDPSVAVRGPAGIVPDLEEAFQVGREEPGCGIHRHQLPGAGGGVEAPDPQAQVVARCMTEGQVPGGGCRDGAVAGEPGGFAVGLQEGAVGHDELDLHPGHAAGDARGPFDEGVGRG